MNKLVSKNKSQNIIVVQILRSLYGLKQSGRIWYHRFKVEMLTLGFTNNDIALCLFIKHIGEEFIILAIYVDDKSIFGTPRITTTTIAKLKATFEMKDMGHPTYCLRIQLETLLGGVFIHNLPIHGEC